MKELAAFLKNHLVLVLCIAVAVMAIGAGIWFMLNPQQIDPTETTATTGAFNEDLNTDLGFSDIGSGIVNIPGGDTASGEVTPINPDSDVPSGTGESETTGVQENVSGSTGSSGNNAQTGTVEVSGGVIDNPFK